MRPLLALLPLLGSPNEPHDCAATRAPRGVEGGALPNLPLRTLGGLQLWADLRWWKEWRLQENVWTGHCRLLDPSGTRRAWGDFQACERALARFRAQDAQPELGAELVVLLHGLGRPRGALARLQRRLEERGFQVARLSYPSTRLELAAHADHLEGLLADLPGVERVSFVGHSLGGLLARELLSRPEAAWRQRLSVGALVSLGTPHGGASLADRFQGWAPVRWVLGPCVRQTSSEAVSALPMPDVPLGAIAAGRREGGWNPLIPGDDDGVVGVSEALPVEASDTLRVPGFHSVLMNDPQVVEAVARFLRHGSFEPEAASESEG